MVNKKGWIKIVEAFLSAMLVIVVLVLVVMNQQNNALGDNSAQVYGSEILVIRSVQMNDTLRSDVLSVQGSSLPSNSENSTFPAELNNSINSKIPGYLICGAEICRTNSTCDYWKDSNAEIYSQQTLISATLSDYNPRVLKLFCREK